MTSLSFDYRLLQQPGMSNLDLANVIRQQEQALPRKKGRPYLRRFVELVQACPAASLARLVQVLVMPDGPLHTEADFVRIWAQAQAGMPLAVYNDHCTMKEVQWVFQHHWRLLIAHDFYEMVMAMINSEAFHVLLIECNHVKLDNTWERILHKQLTASREDCTLRTPRLSYWLSRMTPEALLRVLEEQGKNLPCLIAHASESFKTQEDQTCCEFCAAHGHAAAYCLHHTFQQALVYALSRPEMWHTCRHYLLTSSSISLWVLMHELGLFQDMLGGERVLPFAAHVVAAKHGYFLQAPITITARDAICVYPPYLHAIALDLIHKQGQIFTAKDLLHVCNTREELAYCISTLLTCAAELDPAQWLLQVPKQDMANIVLAEDVQIRAFCLAAFDVRWMLQQPVEIGLCMLLGPVLPPLLEKEQAMLASRLERDGSEQAIEVLGRLCKSNLLQTIDARTWKNEAAVSKVLDATRFNDSLVVRATKEVARNHYRSLQHRRYKRTRNPTRILTALLQVVYPSFGAEFMVFAGKNVTFTWLWMCCSIMQHPYKTSSSHIVNMRQRIESQERDLRNEEMRLRSIKSLHGDYVRYYSLHKNFVLRELLEKRAVHAFIILSMLPHDVTKQDMRQIKSLVQAELARVKGGADKRVIAHARSLLAAK